MTTIYRSAALTALLAPLLTACGAGGSEPDTDRSQNFGFGTMAQTDAAVTVLLDGQPATGAIVSIVDALLPATGQPIEDAITGGHHATARVGSDGIARATMRLPKTQSQVDVVVLHPGSEGPYSEESLRGLWGPFAPAARIHVTRQQLVNLTINLQEVTQ